MNSFPTISYIACLRVLNIEKLYVKRIGNFDFKEYLEEFLTRNVNLITENGIRPQMGDKILN